MWEVDPLEDLRLLGAFGSCRLENKLFTLETSDMLLGYFVTDYISLYESTWVLMIPTEVQHAELGYEVGVWILV